MTRFAISCYRQVGSDPPEYFLHDRATHTRKRAKWVGSLTATTGQGEDTLIVVRVNRAEYYAIFPPGEGERRSTHQADAHLGSPPPHPNAVEGAYRE